MNFIQNQVFRKFLFEIDAIIVSNSLDLDKVLHSVGLDLDPNGLHKLSEDNTRR